MREFGLFRLICLVSLLLAAFFAPAACADSDPAAVNIVCTTSVLTDMAESIGGDRVQAISIADPALCPHMQSDIIPSRIQLNMDFIRDADLFFAYNDSNDVKYNMPAVSDFMQANGFGAVAWKTVSNPSRGWNTPDNARQVAEEVKEWLTDKDPANSSFYQQGYDEYSRSFDSIQPTEEEKGKLNRTSVIVMLWQREPVQKWLGMNVVNYFAPEFALNGTKTAAKMVDDINANPDKYENVSFIIENMQSGELAKGIEEALKDRGINATRVVFTNFPGSVEGADSMAEVLEHNKQQILQRL